MLNGRRILVGITGGIAAYKTAELARLLIKSGANVRVVMTEGGKAFITPLTLQALSGNPVHLSLLDTEAEAGMGHIELAKWAEMVVVAPASADFIARFTVGMANDLLTTLCLATEAPIAIAPAMNQAMWKNSRTQRNINELTQALNVYIWGPGEGEQACGDVGLGRMLEPEQLHACINNYFCHGPLHGKRVVITAGPTREAIDPVRYVSNHSSGKMGYALAVAARDAGATVELISGPVALPAPSGVKLTSVSSALDMLNAAEKATDQGCDIFIASAAVADYRPEAVPEQKIKKSQRKMVIELIKNPDIVASIAARPDKPFTVGFAAETQDVIAYAEGKLKNKKLDMIVANDVSDQRIGFNSEDNAVTVLWDGGSQSFSQQSKLILAGSIVELIVSNMQP
ncbi:bifunctional phosphopantothenoylcysteine decarboxylase/phosphopantothenate--cysteine ligase CoaBC [Alkalimarinus alittae]|uniref:Coenzyme A biosynthesis bifunctional protein CoaBC n=1 Tax=Alkalimarinus alittae TaxID=2961619 RepID=A0ABY6N0T9_9ALTE|nr:bifunctional phosphopantothenoylcysteine decarboxylase/phosphopantothenate--cysteine ligase CoaBC [Alkalimarinus alittae]UZE95727.1 bifunctional phosphopantothenoylcysteine decarboxylase/phosphopantothenate--cysteine ligase CoaBC [Alkalimarinus alittae]